MARAPLVLSAAVRLKAKRSVVPGWHLLVLLPALPLSILSQIRLFLTPQRRVGALR